MTLNVLRDGQEMMKLVRYNVTTGSTSAAENDIGSLGNVNSQSGGD